MYTRELKLHGWCSDAFALNGKVKRYGEEYKYGLTIQSYAPYEMYEVQEMADKLKEEYMHSHEYQYYMDEMKFSGYEPYTHVEDYIKGLEFNFESLYSPKLGVGFKGIEHDSELEHQEVEVLATMRIHKDANIYITANYIDRWYPDTQKYLKFGRW